MEAVTTAARTIAARRGRHRDRRRLESMSRAPSCCPAPTRPSRTASRRTTRGSAGGSSTRR
ncbi:hypothetical protein ACFQV4_22245 [Streptomyces thermocarboxydus]